MLEFNIESKPEMKLRFKDISPTKLLALRMTIDLNDVDKTTKLFNFILENTETEISGTWTTVKTKDRDVYFPVGFEKETEAMLEICFYFLNNVLKPVFQKSRG